MRKVKIKVLLNDFKFEEKIIYYSSLDYFYNFIVVNNLVNKQ